MPFGNLWSRIMTRTSGIKNIDEALWEKDEYDTLCLTVRDKHGDPVIARLKLRPVYCDRGHIELLIDGNLYLDHADSFPRYFFSFDEADLHTRTFLKWRLWEERTYPHKLP